MEDLNTHLSTSALAASAGFCRKWVTQEREAGAIFFSSDVQKQPQVTHLKATRRTINIMRESDARCLNAQGRASASSLSLRVAAKVKPLFADVFYKVQQQLI